MVCRIPDLKFDLFVIDNNHSCTELDANGQVMDWLETFVRELQQQTGLSHTYT